jgi:hypothetical protein
MGQVNGNEICECSTLVVENLDTDTEEDPTSTTGANTGYFVSESGRSDDYSQAQTTIELRKVLKSN